MSKPMEYCNVVAAIGAFRQVLYVCTGKPEYMHDIDDTGLSLEQLNSVYEELVHYFAISLEQCSRLRPSQKWLERSQVLPPETVDETARQRFFHAHRYGRPLVSLPDVYNVGRKTASDQLIGGTEEAQVVCRSGRRSR